MIFDVLAQVLFLIQILLIVYFILSWFPLNPEGIPAQIYAMLDRLFYPILSFLRKYIPRVGMFDLSGMVLIIGIIFLRTILLSL